jgi:hypothetical protein
VLHGRFEGARAAPDHHRHRLRLSEIILAAGRGVLRTHLGPECDRFAGERTSRDSRSAIRYRVAKSLVVVLRNVEGPPGFPLAALQRRNVLCTFNGEDLRRYPYRGHNLDGRSTHRSATATRAVPSWLPVGYVHLV